MENKVVIKRTVKPAFHVEFYDTEMTFKNMLSLSGGVMERISKDQSVAQILKTLRAAAADLEQFEEVVVNAEQGDILELFRLWSDFSKDTSNLVTPETA